MYLLDPDQGRRRRAGIRDRVGRAARISADAVEATRRDALHRASGAAARIRGRLHREPADDRVLVERVRAQLGRVVSHPHAIAVQATDGIVTLRGVILQAELPQLLSSVKNVPGVRDLVSELEAHVEPGNVPALQGSRPRPGLQAGILQRGWSPTAGLLIGTAGVVLAMYALRAQTR